MESSQKISYRLTPCKAPGANCSEYADYDPCESSDDITDKDLAELLKEEKLQFPDRDTKSQDGGKKTTEKDANKTTGEEADGAEEGTQCAKKRRNCRKFIKNPFYTNRLNFSSDLPPPPPEPPPQFFPRVDDTASKDRINCQKRRRKCRKRAEERDGRRKECETTDGLDDEGQRCQPSEDEDMEGKGGIEDTEDEDDTDNTGCCHDDEGEEYADTEEKKRRRCIRNQAKFPCKKRVSEISISLQPRQIPAAQRDLPPTCPKETAIMERQMKMGCAVNCNKKKCKKHSSK